MAVKKETINKKQKTIPCLVQGKTILCQGMLFTFHRLCFLGAHLMV
jgi:hypothetical protein